MTIPTAINSTDDISGVVLLSYVIDIVMKKQQEQQNQDFLPPDKRGSFTNGTALTSHIKAASDGVTHELLMPVWAYQTAAVYLICISVIGLLMNVVVVIVVLNDSQKSPLNWMLLNLACSDGIIAGFGAPISASAAFQFDWPFGDELCVAYAMIMSTAGIGSITTLTALALWRCQLVVYCPAKRSSAFANNNGGKLGHCQAVLLLAIIWTYSLAVTCPPLFGWGRYDREAAHISCSVNWESKMDNNRSYIFYIFTFGLFVPLAVIVVSYVSILRVVRKAGKFKKTMSTTLHNVEQPQEIADQQQPMTAKKSEPKKQTSDAAEKRVTVMVACMVGAFMTAWTPYSILSLVETFMGDTSSTTSNSSNVSSGENVLHYVGAVSPGFATIPSLFAKTSAVLNPLIYGLLNTQFRTAWEKFSWRLLGRRQRHRRKNQDIRRLFSCAGHRSPTLKPSTSVHFSMKEMASNESQSGYVMARQLVASSPVARFAQHEQPIRLKFLSPSLASSSSTADADTTIAHQQSIQMKCFKNSFLQHQQVEEEERNEPGKLMVILSITESTSCTTTTDDHVFTTMMDDESVFTDQQSQTENISESVDVSVIFSPG